MFEVFRRHRMFRAAGVDLGVSASALSHAVKVFEARLGVRFLNRLTRSVTLTAAGEGFDAALLLPLAAIGEVIEQLNRLREEPAWRICIDANRLLPCCAPRFRRSYLRLQCLALRWRSGRGRTVFVARKFGEDRGKNSGSGGFFGG
ncbi:LysR family transcriptional regulator [Novosphingobium ginsenosidimutans]|uniref:LysR family transcriptional regulator n=2 Tax=Novosphingobium ginsenosidimutans TaxID=1176536 RepID=A0A5B8S6D8_9SPHN|nr:LysR family transcriptional regulator [Novosphingobium ginsenosidimutans]QEA16983.1 LysR family transcriptional regulator [Novosphingobium ginsenosidimutans]